MVGGALGSMSAPGVGTALGSRRPDLIPSAPMCIGTEQADRDGLPFLYAGGEPGPLRRQPLAVSRLRLAVSIG